MNNKRLLGKRVIFSSNRKHKRNMFVFDAGLHTLHLKQLKNEKDHEFVTRYLLEYFNGCKKRGGPKYKKFYLTDNEDDKYCLVWGIRNHL